MEAVDAIKSYFAFILIFTFLSFSLQIYAQEKGKVDAQFLFNYYEQDGNNSPVTGGIGTEKLNFYGPSVVVNVALDSTKTFNFNGGADYYTSASSDNIDFNVSSASAEDLRSHVQIGMTHYNVKKSSSFSYNASFSIESDYTSLGFGGNYNKGFKNYSTWLNIALQVYIDDTRWGRLSSDKILKLLYPVELRNKEWETRYIRQTYGLSINLSRLINKRLNATVFFDPTYQNGLLATTFHRIYFSDITEHVIEKLPYSRLKLPLGFRTNYYVNSRFIIKGFYRFYADTWKIFANTFEIETPIKLTKFVSIYPFYRFHTQTAAEWFRPYKQHLSSQEFYTSDYDLSKFTSHKYGLGLHLYPAKGLWVGHKNGGLTGLQARMGWFNRSNGLNAFFVSTVFSFGKL